LRFGTRVQIRDHAIPEINRQISRKATGGIKDVASALESEKQEICILQKQLEEYRRQIELIPKTKAELADLQGQLSDKKDNFAHWRDSLNTDHRRLFLDFGLTVDIASNEAGRLLQKINKWNTGVWSRLFFRLLKESELETMLRNINAKLSDEIKEYVAENAPWASGNENLLGSGRRNLKFTLELSRTEKKLLLEDGKWKGELSSLEQTIENIATTLRNLEEQKELHEMRILELASELVEKGSRALKLAINQELLGLDVVNAQRFVAFLPVQNVWQDGDLADLAESCEHFLDGFSAICLTNLSVKNSLPLKQSLIDLLVIDEASQCDMASAIPLIARAKRVVVIGDPLQLRHITSVKKYEQEYLLEELELLPLRLDYVEHSLYDHCFELANKFGAESIFLKEHYRCHPEIAAFSNTYFYERRLGQTMTIKTSEDQFTQGDPGLNWYDVAGAVHATRNINMAEINTCISLATQLAGQYPKASIGIVTPFRDQYQALFNSLDQELRGRIKVDTVHKYQGDEKDIIIFSLVVAENSPPRKARFLSNNEYLINVAITRARSSLYIVGDFDYCKSLRNGASPSPLSQLARYAEALGRVHRD
jgi:hypothetical protein